MADYAACGWAQLLGQQPVVGDHDPTFQDPNVFPEPRPYAETSTPATDDHSLTRFNTQGVLLNTVSNEKVNYEGSFDTRLSGRLTAGSQDWTMSLRSASHGFPPQFPVPGLPLYCETVTMASTTASIPILMPPTFPNAFPVPVPPGPPSVLPFPSANSIEQVHYNLELSAVHANYFKQIVSWIFANGVISYHTLNTPLDPLLARLLGKKGSKNAYTVFLKASYDNENGGPTQYTCGLCEKANWCNAEREASRHVLKYHLGVGLKCPGCGEICFSTSEATRHTKKCHASSIRDSSSCSSRPDF